MKPAGWPALLAALVLWAATIALLGAPITEVEFNNDAWLPDDHQVELDLDRLAAEFEPGETLLLVLPLAEDFFASAAFRQRISRLEDALDELEPVTETRSPLSAQTILELPTEGDDRVAGTLEIGGYDYALDRGALIHETAQDADAAVPTYREVFSAGPYYGRLLSADARLAAVQLRLNTRENQIARQAAVAQIRQLADQHWPEGYWMVGATAIKNELNLRIGDDLIRLLFLALGGTVVLLRLLLGSWARTLLIVSCAGGCTLVALAWLPRLGIPLTAPGLILPVMIVTVALADSLHLLMYWDKAHDSAPSPLAAVLQTLKALWLPCLSASVTTAVGCGTFILSDILVLADFSEAAILGIFSAYPLMILPLLAALALRPALFVRSKAGAFSPEHLWAAPLRFVHSELKRSAVHPLLLVLLPCTLLSVGLYRLHTESNFLAIFFQPDEEIREGFRLVDAHLGGSGSVDVILDTGRDGHFRAHDAMERVVNLEQVLAVPNVNRTDSYALPLRQVHPRLAGDPATAGRLPRSDEELEQEIFFLELSRAADKRGVLEPYVDFDYSASRLDLHTPDLLSADLDVLIRNLRARLDAFNWDGEITITGFGVFLHQLSELILDTQAVSLMWTLILISLVFLVQFRPLPALLGLIVNFIPLAATAGLISWLGLPYDFGSILVIGVTLGFAVDDTLHLLHHYKRGQGAAVDRIDRALTVAGPAILTAGLTLGFGLSLLLSSQLVLIDRFAAFAIVGLVLSLFCALVLLPALLLVLDSPPQGEAAAAEKTA